jgi:mannopine transport system permease protein
MISHRGRIPPSASLLLLAPIAILMLCVFYIPICSLLLKSITEPTYTLQNYRRLTNEPIFAQVFWRTTRISVATTVIALLLGFPVSMLLVRLRGWLSILVMGCVLIPLWTSVLIRSYAWIILLQRTGIVNSWLLRLGLISQPLALLNSESAVLIAMSHVLLPFMILPIYATLCGIPSDLAKASRSLGAGTVPTFAFVTLPLSLPGVFAGCLIVFVLALGFYVTPVMVGGPRTLVIATLISQQAMEFLDWPFASAISVALLVLSVGTTMLLRRLIGLKGMIEHG